MKKTMTMAVAIAMAVTGAHAATVRTVADGTWTNGAIWNTGGIPAAGDTARIHNNNVVTVDSTVAYNTNKVQLGFAGTGTLNVNSTGVLNVNDADLGNRDVATVLIDGGSFNAAGTFKVGNGGASYTGASGQVTINNDGMLTIAGNFFVGGNSANGALTLNSGTISALNLTLGDADDITTASLDLLGGSMTLTSGTLNIASTNTGSALLNIENDAQMILGGNKLGNIDTYVAANLITFSNGSGAAGVGDQTWANGSGDYLHAAFDGSDTTVWVNQTIPEPATLGMITATGLGILIIRRRFLI